MSTKKTNVFIIILAVIFWPITIIVLLAKSLDKSSNEYKKVFPHVTTDDNSSDADKEIDDMIFIDMMDDE